MEHDSCTLGEPLAFTENKLAGDNLSLQNALKILSSCNGSFLKDELAISRKPSKSPQTIMKELVSPLLGSKGMSSQLLEQLPARFVFSDENIYCCDDYGCLLKFHSDV
jgi:tRNA wybutosine-synthesizing protein 3